MKHHERKRRGLRILAAWFVLLGCLTVSGQDFGLPPIPGEQNDYFSQPRSPDPLRVQPTRPSDWKSSGPEDLFTAPGQALPPIPNGFDPMLDPIVGQPVELGITPIQTPIASASTSPFPSLCQCDPCRSPFWFRGQVLLWWLQSYDTQPLLTSSPAGTPQSQAGVLGQPNTRVVIGGDVGDELRVGGLLQAGWWWDAGRRRGFQGEFFGLDHDDGGVAFSDPADGSILARPFFNTDPAVNGADAQILSMPGLASGSFAVGTSSQVLSGAPSFRWNMRCCDCTDACCNQRSWRLDGILGYRYFQLRERLTGRETLIAQTAPLVVGTTFELNDRIETTNDFHGIEVGGVWQRQLERWNVDVTGLVALGTVRSEVDRDGSTRIIIPGGTDTTRDGGFWVRPEDIGRSVENDFAALPQIRANLGYWLNSAWKLTAGYNVAYLSSVFRPGDFVTTSFDGTTLGATPTPGGVSTTLGSPESLWLHGGSIGLSYHY